MFFKRPMACLLYPSGHPDFSFCALQAPNSALGFRVVVSKWLILVRLLLGEIPEHQDFTQPGLRKPLQPYYQLTQAVRGGDLGLFRYAATPPLPFCRLVNPPDAVCVVVIVPSP